jgi:hypothetical protein
MNDRGCNMNDRGCGMWYYMFEYEEGKFISITQIAAIYTDRLEVVMSNGYMICLSHTVMYALIERMKNTPRFDQ